MPAHDPGCALVRTAASLVSAGTERMLVDFAEKSLVGKARSRPDLVRQVLDKARREGLLTTLEAAFNRLDQPMPLGYSSAGTIVAAGRGAAGFPASGSGWPAPAAAMPCMPSTRSSRQPARPPAGWGRFRIRRPSPPWARLPCTASAWRSRSWASGWRSSGWGCWGCWRSGSPARPAARCSASTWTERRVALARSLGCAAVLRERGRSRRP